MTRLFLIICFVGLLYNNLFGQIVPQIPEYDWLEYETKYFHFYYTEDKKWTLEKISTYADEIYEKVTTNFNYKLRKKVKVVLLDNRDSTNGSALSNLDWIIVETTNLYFDNFNLRGRGDWLKNAFTHEFSHIVSLKASTAWGERAYSFVPISVQDKADKNIFMLFTLPLICRIAPYWWAEGIAQHSSELTGYDKWDTHRDMFLRMATLEDNLLDRNDMGVQRVLKGKLYPELGYNIGFSISKFISDNFSTAVHEKIANNQGKEWNLKWEDNYKSEYITNFDKIYTDWKKNIEDTYINQANTLLPLLKVGQKIKTQTELQKELDLKVKEKDSTLVSEKNLLNIKEIKEIPRLTEAEKEEKLTREGTYYTNPKLSPDGKYLAFVRDGRLVVEVTEPVYTEDKKVWLPSTATDANVSIKSFEWHSDSQTILISARYRDTLSYIKGFGYDDIGLITISDFIEKYNKQLAEKKYTPLKETIVTSLYTNYWKNFFNSERTPSARLSNGKRINEATWSFDGKKIIYVQGDGETKFLKLLDVTAFTRTIIAYHIVDWLKNYSYRLKFDSGTDLKNSTYLIDQIKSVKFDTLKKLVNIDVTYDLWKFADKTDNVGYKELYSDLIKNDTTKFGNEQYLNIFKEILNLDNFESSGSDLIDHFSTDIVPFTKGIQYHSPQFSPDSKKVVFYRYYKERQSIWILDLGTKEEIPLVFDNNEARDPQWSKSGKYITYSTDSAGIFNIFQYDLETKTNKQITNVLGSAFMPFFDETSGIIYYSGFSSFGFDLYKIAIKEAANNIVPLANIDLAEAKATYSEPEVYKEIKGKPYSLTHIPLQIYPEFQNFNNQLGFGVTFSTTDYLQKHDILFRGFFDEDQIYTIKYENTMWYPRLWLGATKIMNRRILTPDAYLASDANKTLQIQKNPAFFGKISQDIVSFGSDYDILGYDLSASFQYRDIFGETASVLYGGADVDDQFFPMSIDENGDLGDLGAFKVLVNYGADISLAMSSMSDRDDNDINPIGYATKFKYALTYTDIDERLKKHLGLRMFGMLPKTDPKNDYKFHYLNFEFNYFKSVFDFIPLPLLKNNSIGFSASAGAVNKTVRIYDKLFLGGKQLFRTFRDISSSESFPGYGSYSLYGETRFLLNVSYKFPLLKDAKTQYSFIYFDDIYMELFGDAGNTWDYKKTRYYIELKDGSYLAGPHVLFDAGASIKLKNIIFYYLPLYSFVTVAHGFQDKQKYGFSDADSFLRYYIGIGAGL